MLFRVNVYHTDDGPGDQYITIEAEDAEQIPQVVAQQLGHGWVTGATHPQTTRPPQ